MTSRFTLLLPVTLQLYTQALGHAINIVVVGRNLAHVEDLIVLESGLSQFHRLVLRHRSWIACQRNSVVRDG